MKKIFALTLLISSFSFGQEKPEDSKEKYKFIFEPDSLSLNVGETGTVTIKLVDANGELSQNPFYIFGRPRRALESKPRLSDSTGVANVTIKAFKPGKLSLSVRSISQKEKTGSGQPCQ